MEAKKILTLAFILFTYFFETHSLYSHETSNSCENKDVSTPTLISFEISCQNKPVNSKTVANTDVKNIYFPNFKWNENFKFRWYDYNDKNITIGLTFNKNISKYTLKTLTNNFVFSRINIPFPNRTTATSTFSFSPLRVIRTLDANASNTIRFTFDDYHDGILTGSFEGIITEITERIMNRDPNCRTGDIMGLCFKTEIVNLPFLVKFSLALE